MSNLVQENDCCCINLQNDERYVFITKLTAGTWVKAWKKTKFLASELVGQPYGALFKVEDCKLVRIDTEPNVQDLLRLAKASGEDNRNIPMKGDAQGLSQEAIEEMKKQGKKPEEIIAALMANSATLESKTAFAQEKWLKKKMAKYVSFFRLIRPTGANLVRAFWMKDADKIEGLRWDSLGWMLNYAHLRHGSRPLVFDGANGILSGAVAERMWDQAELITSVHQAAHEPKHVISFFNFPAVVLSKIQFVSFPKLMSALPSDHFHSLLLAVNYDPCLLVQQLWPSLVSGSPFVIYAQFAAAFEGLMLWLRRNQLAVEVKVNETFFRQYQILENRSHPDMRMHNASGFVLSGVKVTPSIFLGNPKQVIAGERKLEKKSKQQKEARKESFRKEAAREGSQGSKKRGKPSEAK